MKEWLYLLKVPKLQILDYTLIYVILTINRDYKIFGVFVEYINITMSNVFLDEFYFISKVIKIKADPKIDKYRISYNPTQLYFSH